MFRSGASRAPRPRSSPIGTAACGGEVRLSTILLRPVPCPGADLPSLRSRSSVLPCASPILDHGLRTSSGESLTTAGSTVRRPRQRDGVARPIRVLMCNPGCVGFQRLRPTWAATDLYAAWRHLYVCWSPPTHGIDTISEFFDGFVVRGRVAGESFSRNKWHRPTL